ncbi:MAG: insulinase family protein [Lentisphaeria bacterium]|nr:insulinase family protein [Lentisphaeria bacterium]
MNHICILIAVLGLVLTGCQTGTNANNTPVIDQSYLKKHTKDSSKSLVFVLPNKMKVILLSDKAFNDSAASLNVSVGSLSDPKERGGLAHFLEHLLFMGTEKYPNVADYRNFLKKHGGYSNAYTAGTDTNYHFKIHNKELDGALDRFSQFFIAPLFSKKYIEREKNAVNSEFQKNLQNDYWRRRHLTNSLFKKGHAINHFSTGNLNTLKGIKRDEFIRFYDRYYSANRMTLAILSNKPLEEMKSMVLKYFTKVKNNDRPVLHFDPVFLEEKPSFRLLKVEPVKDSRLLNIIFPLPDFNKYMLNRPDGMIGFCIGHEGKGSLLSYLKQKGYATSLSAGGHMHTLDYGRFSITMNLTALGLKHYKEVIKACLVYIEKLKKDGVPEHAFSESKNLSALGYTYDNHGEGTGRAIGLASRLADYPMEIAEKQPYLYSSLNPKANSFLLSYLRPDNMLCTLVAKGLKTDKTEAVYGTKYSYSESDADYKELLTLPSIEALELPRANPFIRDTHELLPSKEGASEIPQKVVDDKAAILWYSQDHEFKRPKISARFQILLPRKLLSPKSYVLMKLYTSCLNEQLNEIAYEASEAGVSYFLSYSIKGLELGVSGYSSSVQPLFKRVLQSLSNITISETRFNAINDRITRGWKNFEMGPAWRMSQFASSRIRSETFYVPKELLPIIMKVKFADVKAFGNQLLQTTFINSLIHGNITKQESIQMLRDLQASLKSKTLDKKLASYPGVLIQKNKADLYVYQVPSNNSAIWSSYYFGEDSPALRAASRVIDNFIESPYYTQMRTKDQLGYIVWSFASQRHGTYYLSFIIQSGTHPGDALLNKSEPFVRTLPDKFKAISKVQFEQLKLAVETSLLKKPKSISAKRSRFYTQAFEHDAEFDRIKKEIAALKKLTQKQVHAYFEKAINPATSKKIDILIFAKQHKIPDSIKATITDIPAFKKTQSYRLKN